MRLFLDENLVTGNELTPDRSYVQEQYTGQ